MPLPFGGFFLSLIIRNAISGGLSYVSDKAVSRVIKPKSGADAKLPEQSWTIWFADILFGAAFWINVLPLISQALDTSNILGRWETFFLALIALVVKGLRYKTTQPIV
jgi:hypothetical protein